MVFPAKILFTTARIITSSILMVPALIFLICGAYLLTLYMNVTDHLSIREDGSRREAKSSSGPTIPSSRVSEDISMISMN